MSLTFSTAEVPRARRLSSLREAISSQFLDLDLAPLTPDAGDDLGTTTDINRLWLDRLDRRGRRPCGRHR